MIDLDDELIDTLESNMGLKILTQKEFEKAIKEIMEVKRPITMIDSVLLYCEQNNLEVETAASLITPKMKTQIENEAISARMVTGCYARLPIPEE